MAQLLTGTRVYGNTSIDSQLIVGNVTPYAATSNTTGSLIVTGGVGITGNVYTGNIVITGITSNGITFADGTRQITAATSGGGGGASLSGYLANTIIVANSTGFLSNSNAFFTASNNTLATSNVYVTNRVGFANANNILVVYQVYNANTNSLDTIFG
jgi:hypothetical protein